MTLLGRPRASTPITLSTGSVAPRRDRYQLIPGADAAQMIARRSFLIGTALLLHHLEFGRAFLHVIPKPLARGVRASLLDQGPETEPDMPIYPLELCKRLEEKWKRRAGETGSTSQTPQTGKNRSVVGSAPQEEGDAILSRWPWLLAIGQGLQSEYAALKQPVEKRLVTLLKKLRRSRAR